MTWHVPTTNREVISVRSQDMANRNQDCKHHVLCRSARQCPHTTSQYQINTQHFAKLQHNPQAKSRLVWNSLCAVPVYRNYSKLILLISSSPRHTDYLRRFSYFDHIYYSFIFKLENQNVCYYILIETLHPLIPCLQLNPPSIVINVCTCDCQRNQNK